MKSMLSYHVRSFFLFLIILLLTWFTISNLIFFVFSKSSEEYQLKFEKSLEEFYAICDQIEMHLVSFMSLLCVTCLLLFSLCLFLHYSILSYFHIY